MILLLFRAARLKCDSDKLWKFSESSRIPSVTESSWNRVTTAGMRSSLPIILIRDSTVIALR